jgi:hypothetical protein
MNGPSPAPQPVLDEWRDLAERENAYGFESGDPFMVDPEYRVDIRLTGCLAGHRSRIWRRQRCDLRRLMAWNLDG